MKKILPLLVLISGGLFAQGTITDPDNLTGVTTYWGDESNFYAYYVKTQSSSFSLDQKAKPFKMWFYRLDQSGEVHEKTYDFEKQYTVGQAINVTYRHHRNYFFCILGDKVVCFDLLTDDFWDIADAPEFGSTYDHNFYSYYHEEANIVELYFPGKTSVIMTVDLNDKSATSKTFGFEGLVINEFISRVGNRLLLTAKTEENRVLYIIYDLVEDEGKMMQFPSFVKSYTNKMFFINEAADKIYFYMNKYDASLFHSENWEYIFEVDMETGESKGFHNLENRYVKSYHAIGEHLLVETSNLTGKQRKYLSIINGQIGEVNTDELELVDIYTYENNVYGFLIVKPKNYRLVQIDKNTLEITTVKDITIKPEDYIKPYNTKDGSNWYSYFKHYDDRKNAHTIYNQPPY